MDVYVCFGENLKAHGTEAVLFSVTAPGSDHLPWDESACAVAGDHKHSGLLGCQVEAGQALVWNESAQHRCKWSLRHARGQHMATFESYDWMGNHADKTVTFTVG